MDFDGGSDSKPRLSEAQKKRNHIDSEKKRREAIRAGFERLSTIVPECKDNARSESIVLQKTVRYLKELLNRKDELRIKARAINMGDGDFEKIYNDIEKTVKAEMHYEEEERKEAEEKKKKDRGSGSK